MESASCVAVIDSNGRFVFINSNFQNELKANVIKIMHMSWFDYIHADDLEICRQTIACCTLTNRKPPAGLRLRDRSGQVYNWEITPLAGEAPASDRFLLWKTKDDLVPNEDSLPMKNINEAILRAQQQERTTIGQELHDNVNQILFTCKLYLDLIKPSGGEQIFLKNKTQEFILMAIDEIRKLSKELVSPRLADLGFITCIKKLIDELKVATLFQIDFRTCNEQDLDAVHCDIQVTLFRIIQEQVKNIIKHSKARQVSLQLWTVEDQVHLLIEDDGIGFDPNQATPGIGLANICERTRLHNGKVDFNTAPGKGCSLKISIPLLQSSPDSPQCHHL